MYKQHPEDLEFELKIIGHEESLKVFEQDNMMKAAF